MYYRTQEEHDSAATAVFACGLVGILMLVFGFFFVTTGAFISGLVAKTLDLLERRVKLPWRLNAAFDAPMNRWWYVGAFSCTAIIFTTSLRLWQASHVFHMHLSSQSALLAAILFVYFVAISEWIHGRSARLALWLFGGALLLVIGQTVLSLRTLLSHQYASEMPVAVFGLAITLACLGIPFVFALNCDRYARQVNK